MRFGPTSISVLPVTAVCLLLITADARAGIENQQTGEKCWGGDCSDMVGGGSTGSGSANSGGSSWRLANVETYDCTASETEKIHVGVGWLQDNLPAIDHQMGRNGLMDWPGNSRENFEDKLHKDLKFHCINEKNKCDKGIGGITYPVVAQQRINICTDTIADGHFRQVTTEQSSYIGTIAHEIGHLVRWNGHGSDCGFSMSLGFAAEVAHLGVDYDADDFLGGWCPSPPSTSMPSWQDIIEMKQEQKPPLTSSKPLG
jgi:hypothetical protein